MGLNFKIFCLYLFGDSFIIDINWYKYIKCDLKFIEYSGIVFNV